MKPAQKVDLLNRINMAAEKLLAILRARITPPGQGGVQAEPLSELEKLRRIGEVLDGLEFDCFRKIPGDNQHIGNNYWAMVRMLYPQFADKIPGADYEPLPPYQVD